MKLHNCYRAPVLAGLAFVAASGFIQAAIFGNLIYTENDSSITIDGTNWSRETNLVIPATIVGKPVTVIGPQALSRSNFVSIVIPASVKVIGEAAFQSSTYLKSVNIPEGVERIEAETFAYCYQLSSVTLPSTLLYIGNSAFYINNKLAELKIPGKVTKIGASAFGSCRNLKSIQLPASALDLGDGLFRGCGQLATVEFPTGLKRIPAHTFYGCHSLKKFEAPPQLVSIGFEAFGQSNLEEIKLGPKLEEIEENAFLYSSLRAVRIPASVKTIGDHAFAGYKYGYGPSAKPFLVSAIYEGDAPIMGRNVFRSAAPGFRIFVESGSEGFTTPKWKGYRLVGPSPEIVVLDKVGEPYFAGKGVIKFAGVLVGGKAKTAIVTIKNVGNRDLTGIRATLKGGQFSNFAIKNLSKTKLKPGQVAQLTVAFKPKEKGKRVSKLRIISNDRDEEVFDIKMVGTGLKAIQ